jgi:hypothetical protein
VITLEGRYDTYLTNFHLLFHSAVGLGGLGLKPSLYGQFRFLRSCSCCEEIKITFEFPHVSPNANNISWNHYKLLLAIRNRTARTS